MPDKYELIRVFENTMELCENSPELCLAIDNSISQQKIYWESDQIDYVNQTEGPEAELKLTSARTVAAAGNYTGMKVCVLNFASSVNPGGGVKKGSGAQEECICRATTLYSALSDESTAYNVYRRHRELISLGAMNNANSDDIIYTPGVLAIKADTHSYELLPEEKRYSFNVISSAAPDLRHHSQGYVSLNDTELRKLFEKRIDRIFKIAAINGNEALILGAFGCGAFGNDPWMVAEVFKEAANRYIYDFKVIDFAIPGSHHASVSLNYEAFKTVLGK